MSELSNPVQPIRGGQGLSTGRSVLKVLTLLAEHPDGVRASDVARSVLKVVTLLAEDPDGVRAGDVAERVGKSTSTAYYLLASLCEEGIAVRDGVGGRYRLNRAGAPDVLGAGDPHRDVLEPAVAALFLHTRKNCYLGRVARGGLDIVAVRGRQGVAKIPGLGSRNSDGMHALAMGKVVLALSPHHARLRYVQRGLRSFTDATITSPRALMAELDQVRRSGVAFERDEFQEDVCCVAAPMHDVRGRFVATVGLSVTTGVFDAERDRLVEAVLDSAAMSEPLQRTDEVLRREGLTA